MARDRGPSGPSGRCRSRTRPARPAGRAGDGGLRWSSARASDAPMSSRGRETRGLGDSGGFIVTHPAEDLVTDATTQRADGLGLRVAQGPSVLQVRLARPLALELGDGDPVERHVELTVARPAEAMALGVARPDRQRRAAVVTSEGGRRAEATDAGRLADELGRGQRTAAGEGQPRWRAAAD